ncbi:hypothetical protein NE237_029387 [Protea cynaroides]|uniref:Uncharacterized protein n=1 Tax=Protea cynaroides TaxID=273540 RepID=A0A9Q0GU63_9MAGN|nr:hypothetical protein NE237_029387 [Protea cynaroides]
MNRNFTVKTEKKKKGEKKGFFWFLLGETHTARRSQAKDFPATKDVSTTIASKTEETILSKTTTSGQKLSTSITAEFMQLPKIQKQREKKKKKKQNRDQNQRVVVN